VSCGLLVTGSWVRGDDASTVNIDFVGGPIIGTSAVHAAAPHPGLQNKPLHSTSSTL
jgi:hypothetical protein